MTTLLRVMIEPVVQAALLEDLGRAGDITTNATISPQQQMTATIHARKSGTISGLLCAQTAFMLVDPTLSLDVHIQDASKVEAGTRILTVTGSARSILTAERVALNFMGHLAGIASTTADMVDRISETKARIVCTRKTTPGLRMLEKQAVVHGGGFNHRFGLDDAVLVKDNHIAAVGGSIVTVLDRIKEYTSHMTKIEIEVDTLAQLEQVLAHGGADNVLLDNMSLSTLREAVTLINKRMISEASGNVQPETVADIAQTGVDYISSGWLTHSARTLDLGLDIE